MEIIKDGTPEPETNPAHISTAPENWIKHLNYENSTTFEAVTVHPYYYCSGFTDDKRIPYYCIGATVSVIAQTPQRCLQLLADTLTGFNSITFPGGMVFDISGGLIFQAVAGPVRVTQANGQPPIFANLIAHLKPNPNYHE